MLWSHCGVSPGVSSTGVSGMNAPENGRVGKSSRGTGSGGDCFKMFKTVGVNRESCHSWMEA